MGRCNCIYIPHWLDSMSAYGGGDNMSRIIYIPHWLDSMEDSSIDEYEVVFIYIPHWLDSMYKDASCGL